MKSLSELTAWKALQHHHQEIQWDSMQDWFASDSARFKRFSVQCGDMLVDYSKNRITDHTVRLLCDLARESNLTDKIEAFFTGQPINFTENRPALHPALRDRTHPDLWVNEHNIMPDIHAERDKMAKIVDQVRSQRWLGATGKPIRDIVNIGIGGSHLGPQMAIHALADYADSTLRCYFVSNIDGAHLQETLDQIDPERTLFIVSSKSFSTFETSTNFKTIQNWLMARLGTDQVSQHFIAVTAKPDLAEKAGILAPHILKIWDWVGGRYSVWSSIGLPLALMIGMENFNAFLDGAHEMDVHFRTQDFSHNVPVLMGLLGIWYINFFEAPHQAIIPYSHRLHYFRQYIQQADMESNGKMVTQQNMAAVYPTGPIIFGEQGCDSQHSFYQLLHQGSRLVPIDFILAGAGDYFDEHQDYLVASCLSQSQALMQGKHYQTESDPLSVHKTIPGNRPSTLLFLNKVTPHTLGALIALYEHKIFVQGAIWNINSFDQWGVELGKALLPPILAKMQYSQETACFDASTEGLVDHYKKIRGRT